MQRAVPAGLAAVLWTGALAPLAGQSATGVHLMGLGIASVTRVDPVPGGGRARPRGHQIGLGIAPGIKCRGVRG